MPLRNKSKNNNNKNRCQNKTRRLLEHLFYCMDSTMNTVRIREYTII